MQRDMCRGTIEMAVSGTESNRNLNVGHDLMSAHATRGQKGSSARTEDNVNHLENGPSPPAEGFREVRLDLN
jgi:hypothetical protein